MSDLGDGIASRHGIVPGSYALLSLTATGWGMDGAVHERLTAGVAGADDTSRRISSARRSLAHAGGGLSVEGVAEESLTFTVYLPVAGGAAALDGETPVPLP
jgi:hypothetical protein